MKIGIIIGSIRDGRNGKAVGDWVAQCAARRSEDADFETLDIKEFDLPLLTASTLPAMANRQYNSTQVTNWSQVIDSCDGFVFVTPEYNHGVPGAFKNAIDNLGPEWMHKTVAFVSYGADGGTRAVEQWRQIVANLAMLDVRAQVSLSIFRDFGADGFEPSERRDAELATVFDQLIRLTAKVSD
jgi:NAD(P)H-dependent FMN reductase